MAPAYVFVVRHGNRLDAADKQWHLSSPTPYDPPLTYGGWLQSRTLGARIASILREREAEEDAAYEAAVAAASQGPDKVAPPPARKRRKHKVIIHSSPFLRCIQTSIAISSGLSSNPPTKSPASILSNGFPSAEQAADAGRVRPTVLTDEASLRPRKTPSIDKAILRLDPFLGEWASPDYFEHITPPPASSLMIMTAKAELLQKENYHAYPHFTMTRPPAPTPSSQLWNSPIRSHFAERSTSMTNGDSDDRPSLKASFSEPPSPQGYVAPIPAFSVSTSSSIPMGYVAHARDHCVDFDYQWDSTGDDLAWGEGGELPEEWAAMHQRFRKGLRRLVDWYATAGAPGEKVTKTPDRMSPQSVELDRNGADECAIVDDEDAETENVVILVSHGAGCNGLVGGFTHQPVLADFPISSLTVAKRRSEFDSRARMDVRAMASLDDAFSRTKPTVPELYEMVMTANTEHLQPKSATTSRAVSRNGNENQLSTNGFRSALKDINFGAMYGQPTVRSNSTNSRQGPSLRRSSGPTTTTTRGLPISGGITVGSGVTSFSRPSRTNSFGLWSPKSPGENEEEPPMVLNFGQESNPQKEVNGDTTKGPNGVNGTNGTQDTPTPLTSKEDTKASTSLHTHEEEEHDSFDGAAISFPSASGLWGAPPPPDDAERNRDFSTHKRRWTVNER
ncbi:hypothetical protein BX600DRAFT_504369 [Xylariales sp. PMI_506]|nr:hypothetical protein BX600DRAFT_504369 [Xylariales sp. PMI_506]